MRKITFVSKTVFFLVAVLGNCELAHAQVTEFEDIALDGGGPNQTPFIRFDDSGAQKFIVGFNTRFGFWAGSAYSLEIYDDATSGSVVLRNGRVGIHVADPTTDLDIDGNVLITGNLEVGSSRKIKKNIESLPLLAAQEALRTLNPVTFNYLHSPEENSVGFIAEDVPDLVASQSRNSINPMDVVAILTKVVQAQQQTIDQLNRKITTLCGDRKC